MITRTLPVALWLFASLTAFAGEIVGTLQDTEQRAVSDASVVLVQLRRTAPVKGGSFQFKDVPAGSYTLMVNSRVFGSKLFQIDLKDEEVAKPTYTIDLSVHEDLVVTATAVTRSSNDLAQAVGVLNREDLIEKIKPTLGETLATEPGVSSTYAGPAASRPVIRGLGGDRVAILEGGMSSGDVSSLSGDHAVAIDPSAAERIEILRGPASLRYGSSAVGGVVNVVDNRIPEYQSHAPLLGSVELRGSTGSDERSLSSSLEGGKAHWAWHIDGSALDTDDVEIPGPAVAGGEDTGVLANSAIENRKYSVGGSYIDDGGFLGMAVTSFDSLYGIPSIEEEPVRIDMKQRRADLRGERRLAHDSVKALNYRLGYADYEHSELEGEEVGTVFTNKQLDFRGELVHEQLGPFHNGSLGLQYGNRDFRADGEEAFVPPNETDKYALFAYEEYQRPNWSLALGARFEHQLSSATLFTDEEQGLPGAAVELDFDAVSTSAGLVLGRDARHGLSINLTRTERAPTPEELFSNGPHLATGAFEEGDLNLRNEVSLGLDVSLRRKQGIVTGELNLFVNSFDRFIYERFAGDQIDELNHYVFSQADAKFYGGELHVDTELIHTEPHHLHLELAYDLVRGELKDGGYLPRITPDRLKAVLEYQCPSFHCNVEGRRNFEQSRPALLETETAAYTMLDASLGYHFLVGMTNHQLVLRGTNLTDEEARDHASFFKDLTLLPGRNFGLTWRMNF